MFTLLSDRRILGDLGLSEEELEAMDTERKKRHQDKRRDWHHQQMAENYEVYREYNHNKSKRLYADMEPTKKEGLLKRLKTVGDERVEEKEFWCDLCQSAHGSANALRIHKEGKLHLRKEEDLTKAYICTICPWGGDRANAHNAHLKAPRHLKKVEKATADAAKAAATAAAQSRFQLD
jgi:hypothetical protein